MIKQKIIVVNEKDEPIGIKYRDEIDPQEDIYRCSSIWITNSQGEVLLAQRKLTKDHDPGKWGPASSGTVEEGETYESNAYKELEEEIGLVNVNLKLGPKQYYNKVRKFFAQWFFCQIDQPVKEFTLQEEEVEKIEWVGKEDLLTDIKNNPDKYVPSLGEIIDDLVLSFLAN